MPGHAPYLMPDGQPLSKYLTLDGDGGEKKGAARGKAKQRASGKDKIWQHLKKQQLNVADTGYHSEQDEYGVAAKMGSRRRRRWVNDRMLRDMTGPMTMDQIEAQFCPPPWGEMPTKKPPLYLLLQQHRSLWEMLINVDMETEQQLLEELESTERKRTVLQDGATGALKAWHRVPRRLRRLLKTSSPLAVLEIELQLMEFKNSASKEVCLVENQSRYRLLIYEGLCQFHQLRLQYEENVGQEEGQRTFDLKIERRTGDGNCVSLLLNGVEVTCSDVLMALQGLGPTDTLNAKTLRRHVLDQIHGWEENG